MRPGKTPGAGGHGNDLSRPRVREVDPAVAGNDQVVGLHFGGDGFDLFRRRIHHDDLLLPSFTLGGRVNLAVGAKFEAADFRSILQPDGRLRFTDANPIDQAAGQIGEVKVAFRVAPRGVGKLIAFPDQFPVTRLAAVRQDFRQRLIAAKVVLHFRLGQRSEFRPPQPAKRVGQDGAAVLPVVRSVSEDEAVIIASEGERAGHLLVRERPVAVQVVQVVRTVLQENSDRLALRLADPSGNDVPAANVHKAADLAQHLAEVVGSFPRHRKGANPTAAHARDGP